MVNETISTYINRKEVLPMKKMIAVFVALFVLVCSFSALAENIPVIGIS